MSECPFCLIIAGNDPAVREVGRNDSAIVFFPTEPATLGHCLVSPRRHVQVFSDLTDDEVTHLMITAQQVAKGIQSTLAPDGINIIQSNGQAATQSVPHVHIHILPRWHDDQVGEFWPSETNYSAEEKDRVLAKLRATISLSNNIVDPEDRRQHLSFTQDIISRMSQSSSNAKSWLLPVVMSAYGYAFTKPSATVAALGIVATVVFGILDIGYLRTERRYRKLYEDIVNGDPAIPAYSLNYKKTSDSWKSTFVEYRAALLTWTIWPFYGAFLLAGICAFIFASC